MERSTHPLDLLGGSFGVYRHTSHEAFVVKALAWDWFILSTGLLCACPQFVDTPHLWRNLVLGYDSSGCTILLLSDQSRLDAGSRRHRGILFHHLNLSYVGCSSPQFNFGNKKPCWPRGEQGWEASSTSPLPACLLGNITCEGIAGSTLHGHTKAQHTLPDEPEGLPTME